jgi:toxin ParE1/3/4
MSRKLFVRKEARSDIAEITYYIAQDTLEMADRFAEAIGKAYKNLMEFPSIGSIRDYNHSNLKGLRSLSVPGFRKYLIFYRDTGSQVEIIRILHGARDLESLFQLDEEDAP